MLKIFIAGTDTSVGKTYVSVRLLQMLNKHYQTIGIKLIASGCDYIDGEFINDDAKQLRDAASMKLPYQIINPIALPLAIAPHIAAEKIGYKITLEQINLFIETVLQTSADIYLFEGVGGWHVPINDDEMMSDIVIQHKMQVILVVGIKLGCLNHSILTLRAMRSDRVNVIGWIGNCVDPEMQFIDENILMLKKKLSVPCLGVFCHDICHPER